MRENDARLIERAGAGDRAAFEELYRRFAPLVFGMAKRQLADAGSAEEVTQETFTAVWRSAGRFVPTGGSGSSWIYTIARNAIIDRARRQTQPVIDASREVSPDAGPDECAEESWVTWRVQSALMRLPDQERVLVELAYWNGLSQAEIASRLGVPLGTVKTRTRAALKRLRGLLNEVRA